MNYKISYNADFTEPFHGNISVNCRRQIKETYILKNKEDCILCIKDLLDVPVAELTLDQIKKDFSSIENPISEEKSNQIRNYYNGRLSIYNQIIKDFQNNSTIYYDIPSEYNNFFTIDKDKTIYHSLNIRIQLTNEEI